MTNILTTTIYFLFIVKIFRLVYICNKLDLLIVVYYIYIAGDYSSHSLLYRWFI